MTGTIENSGYVEFAANYDREVREYGSFGHDAIFGMCFEYVKPGEKLLDIGIGTGLASMNFSRLGLKAYGLDSSPEMLAACKSKDFAEELHICNAFSETLPFHDGFFNHAVCCGMTHFAFELCHLFKEVARVVINGGIFGFSFSPGETDLDASEEMTAWGVPIFRHSPGYIRRVLDENGLDLLKEQRLLIKGADKVSYDMPFSIMICRQGK